MHASKMKAKINKQEPIKMADRKAERRKHGEQQGKWLFKKIVYIPLLVEEIFAARNFCWGHFGDLTWDSPTII